MRNNNAVEIRQLTKKFSKFQLGPLDMSVPEGAVYGFVGPNGAGKTTTLDFMFGMGFLDSGSIQILGLDHQKDEVAIKQEVAYMSPDLSYHSWGEVRNAIRFLRGFYDTWDQDYCVDLLQRFKIDLTDKILALSFGNKIKLGLALALARHPKVLVIDEPTVGLDAVSKREVFSQIMSLIGDGQHTVLISSHNLSDLERFTDHIGLINNGQMVLEGRTDRILDTFRHINFNLVTDPPKGARIVERDGDGFRVITDRPELYEEKLIALGATAISIQSVTLEELFIGLVEGVQQ